MENYVEVIISSVRVGLMSQNRIILLKEMNDDRYLPIWVEPNQAEHITLALQEIQTARPLTHDLLRNVIRQLNARLVRVEIESVSKDVFFARLVLEKQDETKERVFVDCRPSDAIAMAVRMNCSIYVSTQVMESSSIKPDEDLIKIEQFELEESENLSLDGVSSANDGQDSNGEEPDTSLFDDFIDNMDV